MFIAVFMVGVFAIGVVAIGVGLVWTIVNRRRNRRRDASWEDDLAPGEVKLRPGAGWGNGGSWH